MSDLQEQASNAHAQLFRDPPPRDGSIDDRKPIDEVYFHEDGEGCYLVRSPR